MTARPESGSGSSRWRRAAEWRRVPGGDSIQRQLLESFLLVIALLGLVAGLYSYNTRVSLETYHDEQQRFLFLNGLSQTARDASLDLWSLATQRDSTETASQQYLAHRDALLRERAALPANLADPANALSALNLQRQIDSFVAEGDQVVEAVARQDVAGYSQHYEEAATVAGYVDDGVRRILDRELTAYGSSYQRLNAWTEWLQRLGLVLLILAVGCALVFAWWLARAISRPIEGLVQAAQQVAAGRFDGDPAAVMGPREIRMLAASFNQMRMDLRNLLGEVRHKAELERHIQEAALKNLEMAHLLKEAELRSLQAQINPHFLFNTLNVVSKTAMLEDAGQTSELIATVADLLRYNLQPLDSPVTLGEEVDAVRQYFTIQKTRFRDRVDFVLETEEDALDQLVPCLTLQPLVENSFIHGIESREQGGRITVRVARVGDGIQVTVADNGVGMTPEQVASLLRDEQPVGAKPGLLPVSRGHTTGLGFLNVRRRLELFYGKPGLSAVESAPGQGTVVRLSLPVTQVEEVAGNVQAAHRG